MLRTVILAAIVACAGCVFLVDSSPTGDQFSDACTVAVPSTTCGTCIDTACSAQLNACCGDTTCRNALSAVDQCSEAGACIIDTSSSTAATALESCMAASCPACQVETAAVYDAGIYCSVDTAQGSCDCSTENIYGQATTRCDLTTVPGGKCCADQSWPSAGNCSCGPVSCSSDYTGGCRCSFNLGPSTLTGCNQQAYGNCCASNSQCTCNSNNTLQCDSYSSPVGTCSAPTSVSCSTGQHEVSNCSAQ